MSLPFGIPVNVFLFLSPLPPSFAFMRVGQTELEFEA